MYHYTILQWMFFFYFYSFFGWCFESIVVSVMEKRPVNRGFMRGPFLPLYGSGALLLLVVSNPFSGNLILTYLSGCVAATVLEYVTGVVMEALFKVRYWDYSNQRFNFQGRICLSSTLVWGLLTIFMTEFLQQKVEQLVFMIPGNVLTVITLVLTGLIGADFALSFRTALDLRDVLVRMEQARTELLHIKKRLDVYIALTSEDTKNRLDELTDQKDRLTGELLERKDELTNDIGLKTEELKSGIEARINTLREWLKASPANITDSQRQELGNLVFWYRKNVSEDESEAESRSRKSMRRSLIRSNPGMTSRRFGEVLEEMKKTLDKKPDDGAHKDASRKQEADQNQTVK